MSHSKALKKLDANAEPVSQKGASKKMEEETEAEKEAKLLSKLSDVPRVEMMAGLQVQMTAPGRHIGNDNAKNILAKGAMDLYFGMALADATESLLSMLAVSVASASLDCLTQAASTSPDYLEQRDLNLRHGLKGAAVAAELIKVLDARRGHSTPRRVTVGSVNSRFRSAPSTTTISTRPVRSASGGRSAISIRSRLPMRFGNKVVSRVAPRKELTHRKATH